MTYSRGKGRSAGKPGHVEDLLCPDSGETGDYTFAAVFGDKVYLDRTEARIRKTILNLRGSSDAR